MILFYSVISQCYILNINLQCSSCQRHNKGLKALQWTTCMGYPGLSTG
uniref:Uncharacterized protein n=1 Tax=Anguilla anguilla TaxID=7936 RepID=A0A0E9XZA1_ANGAN